MTDLNGVHKNCPVWDEWKQHRDRALVALNRVENMDQAMQKLADSLQHLSALTDIRDTLLSAATGRDHIPLKAALVVLGVLCSVILGLVFVLVFLLTGEAAGWINSLHR